MGQSVRSKFMLKSVSWAGPVARRLVFETEYDQTIPEDQRFCRATPSGKVEMLVDNLSALAQFELGKSYYFDASPVVAPAE